MLLCFVTELVNDEVSMESQRRFVFVQLSTIKVVYANTADRFVSCLLTNQ